MWTSNDTAVPVCETEALSETVVVNTQKKIAKRDGKNLIKTGIS
jgi:hypothetical protein